MALRMIDDAKKLPAFRVIQGGLATDSALSKTLVAKSS
jgi:hypothetical protein